MRRSLTTLLLTSLTLITHSAFADGMIYQLPKDGTFVVYDLDMKVNAGGQNISATGTLKMSSVGTVTENEKKCRWIEVKLVMDMGGNERIIISKVLVPEENLKSGENAFGNKVRGWVRVRADGETKKVDDKNTGPMPAFLSGPLSEVKKLKSVTVDSKLGKLECEGESGYTTYVDRGRNNKVTFEIRRHKKAPFGVVSSVLSFAGERNGQFQKEVEMTFKLKEVGKNAKSELPDSK